MKTAATASLAVLSVVHWAFTWQATARARPAPSEILAREIAAFDSTKTRMVDQLVELASAMEIPMGIEGIYDPQQQPSPEIHLRGATARDVLQEIVRQNPEYRWEVNQEAVHVFAHSTVNDPRNFLNIKLPHYRAKALDLLGMSWMLRLQIKMFLYPERYRNGWGGGYGGAQPPSWRVPGAIDLYDATVREVLNVLVALPGNAMWITCINPIEMMDNGKYFVQHSYHSRTLEPEKDFYWDLIAANEQ